MLSFFLQLPEDDITGVQRITQGIDAFEGMYPPCQ